MGSIFSDGVKRGIQVPGGSTEYVDPAQAGVELARLARASAEPSVSSIDGSINPNTPDTVDVTQQDPGNLIGPKRPDLVSVTPGNAVPDSTTVSMLQPQPAQPTLAPKEDFRDAYALHPERLTKGGQLRALIGDALAGAAEGAAASAQGNPHIGYPGIGAALGAGFEAPLRLRGSMAAQIQQQRAADLENELRAAQVDLATSKANRMIYHEVGGAGLIGIDPDGKPHVIVPAGQGPDAGDKLRSELDAKAQLAQQYGLTPEQSREFVFGLKTDGTKVSAADQENKFLDIQSRINQKLPVSPAEQAFANAYQKMKTMGATSAAQIRVEGLGEIRQIPVIDTQNGNSLIYANANDINAANKATPGRFVPAGEGSKALSKTALIEDIRGNVQAVRQSLQNMPEFSPTMRAQVAVALKSRDPRSAISSLVGSEAAKSLTPQQQDYLINTSLLIENAMAMRSVLGAGQGSEDLRSAITATIPGPTTPTKGYASKQLDTFEQVLNRLERGVPQVPLANGGGKPGSLKLKGGGAGASNSSGGFWSSVPGAVPLGGK